MSRSRIRGQSLTQAIAASSTWLEPGLGSTITRALVLNMNETGAGGGSYTDEGQNSLAITAVNGAVQTVGAAILGAGGTDVSPGTNEYVKTPTNFPIFRDGALMVSLWIKANALGSRTLITLGDSASGPYLWGLGLTTNQAYWYNRTGAGHTPILTLNDVLSTGVDTHIQFGRIQGRLFGWVDGVLEGTIAHTQDYDSNWASQTLFVGGDIGQTGGTTVIDGFMDGVEICVGAITRGVIVEGGVPYVRDFPVPTAEV